MMQQEKQRLRKPPSSLDQSELKHGSVILNNYILIWLLFRNVSPLFKRRASRDHTGTLIRHKPGSQIKSKPKVFMWKLQCSQGGANQAAA